MLNPAWKSRPLGELFEIGAGKTMSAAARNGTDKTPFLRTSNVLWDEIDLSTVDEMAIPERELPAKLLQPGDLLVCEGGEIGRAAIWNGESEPMSFQNHLHRLRPIAPNVEPRFYVYFLQSAFTQLGLFEGMGNKTTIPNISGRRLAALDVPYPTLVEQRAITATLTHVREATTLHEQLTKTAQDLKRAAMLTLFTRGLRGEEVKGTKIGPMPESWDSREIRDLCNIHSGGTPRKSVAEYWDGDIPWVSGKDLKQPALNDTINHLSSEGVAAGSRIAPADSVLILVRGMGLAKDLPVAVINCPMAFNQDVKALVSRGEFSGRFLRSAIYFGKERLLGHIVASAHGTMTLNLNDIETFQVPCPSNRVEMNEIVAILDVINSKINVHRRKSVIFNDLFKALLYSLMIGEIRVADLGLPSRHEWNPYTIPLP